MAYVLIECCSTSAAATASFVDSGLDAHRAMSAPAAFSVSIRLAVSLVTCRQAATLMPLSGCSFANRWRISSSTGISRAAQSMRFWPSAPSFMSLTSADSTFKKATPSVHELAYDFDAGQALSPAQLRQLDQDLHADDLPAELAHELDGGGRGAASRKNIIHDQDLVARLDRVLVDVRLIGPVLELVRMAEHMPGQLARLADRDEARVEADRDGRAGDETPSLDGRDERRALVLPVDRHQVDDLAKRLAVREQRRDVAKGDPRMRKIGYVPHHPLELVGPAHAHLIQRFGSIRAFAAAHPPGRPAAPNPEVCAPA